MPFTVDQFLTVFERYNSAVWPAQLFSMQWVWMGFVYHLWFFSSINKAAFIFGPFFVLQGILFLVAGVLKGNLRFRFRGDLLGFTGSVFLIYGLVIYPALGYWLGHRYQSAPTFGLPCPTTIFTFGLLLWTDRRFPRRPAHWPLLRCVQSESTSEPSSTGDSAIARGILKARLRPAEY